MEALACQTCGNPCGKLHPCPGCRALYYCSSKHLQMACQLGHDAEECSRMKQQLARAEDIYRFGVQMAHDMCSFLKQQRCHDRGLLQYCCPIHTAQLEDSTTLLPGPQQHCQTAADDLQHSTYIDADQHNYHGLPGDGLQWQQAWATLNPALIPPWPGAAGAADDSTAVPQASTVNMQQAAQSAAEQHQEPPKFPYHAAVGNTQQRGQEGIMRWQSGSSSQSQEADHHRAPKNHRTLGSFCWEGYYRMRNIPAASPAALALHFPLTVWYCLAHVLPSKGWKLPQQGSQLTVAYLGPQAELCLLPVFLELLVLLPGYHTSLHMIGPDVPQQLHGKACRRHSNAGSLTITCWKGCWHDTVQDWQQQLDTAEQTAEAHTTTDGWFDASPVDSTDFNLVFAANAGLPVFPSWIPTLQQLLTAASHDAKQLNRAAAATSAGPSLQPPAAVDRSSLISSRQRNQLLPVVFSDYCEEAVVKSQEMVQAVLGQSFNLETHLNPFRRPTPCHHHGTKLPACSNCFLFGWL